jgi:hypothetical protein
MTFRLKNYDLKSGIEIESFVNSWLGFSSPEGRELVLFAKSHTIQNRGTFATDSNGLKMQQRIRGFKPDFNYSTEGYDIEANYYPINAGIYIKNFKDKKSMG